MLALSTCMEILITKMFPVYRNHQINRPRHFGPQSHLFQHHVGPMVISNFINLLLRHNKHHPKVHMPPYHATNHQEYKSPYIKNLTVHKNLPHIQPFEEHLTISALRSSEHIVRMFHQVVILEVVVTVDPVKAQISSIREVGPRTPSLARMIAQGAVQSSSVVGTIPDTGHPLTRNQYPIIDALTTIKSSIHFCFIVI